MTNQNQPKVIFAEIDGILVEVAGNPGSELKRQNERKRN